MTYIWNDNSRKRVLGRVLQFVRTQGAQDLDNFAQRLVASVTSYVEKEGSFPDKQATQKLVGNLKTSLFRLNSRIKKTDFSSWLENVLSDEQTDSIQQQSVSMESSSDAELGAIRIYIDDIDSFMKVRKIPPAEVKTLVPLTLSEADIKNYMAEIIGEPFVPKDWGGETADLFSTNLRFQGQRVSSGFLLKGPAVKGSLTIAKLGKNGDQIQ